MKPVRLRSIAILLAGIAAMLLPALADAAAPGIPAVVVQGSPGSQSYSLTLQLLILMTAVDRLLPVDLLMMTAFTRIVIVLSILRQAIGAGQSPRTRCSSACRCS